MTNGPVEFKLLWFVYHLSDESAQLSYVGAIIADKYLLPATT